MIPPSILHNVILETKEVVGILESCEDLLTDQPRSFGTTANQPEILGDKPKETTPDPPPQDLSLDILELLTLPQPRRQTILNGMQSFTKAVCTEAGSNRQNPGYIGRNILAKMRKVHEIKKTATQLAEIAMAKKAIQQIDALRCTPKT